MQYLFFADAVIDLPLEDRKCIRYDENIKNFPNVSLTLFANYSRKACFLECQATALYEECGCLPYNFPDFTLVWTHINQTSCDYEGLVCLAQQLGKLDMYYYVMLRINHYF